MDVEQTPAGFADCGVPRMVSNACERTASKTQIATALMLGLLVTGCRSGRWMAGSPADQYRVQPPPAVATDEDDTEATSTPTAFVESAEANREALILPVSATEEVDSDTTGQTAESSAPKNIASADQTPAHAVATSNAQPIDLSTALMLTSGRSPQVAFAQARIEESRAQLDRAESLWLPSLRAGANYNKHEGRIQDVAGKIIETSRGSAYSGLGAGAVGAGSPSVPGVVAQFHVSDAVFQPKIAQQTTRARNANARAAINDELLDTALAHLQLLRATQEMAVAEAAVQQFQELERVTREFAAAGQGLQSDHDRARAELAFRKNELLRASEAVQVASARLAQQVRWEYGVELQPAEDHLFPISLVDHDTPAQGLVATGLSHRPEIAEARHLICEAVERLNRERYAPLIPSVLLGVSYGGQTGGLGSRMEHSGDRFDADAMAFWELRQLGFGEQAAQREARSRIVQTRTKQIALMDQVAREIVECHAQVQSRSEQIVTAEESVSAAQDSFRRNWERIQNGQGLPIEVLQSIQALNAAQREYIRTLADHNAAQFSLHRSLGWPVHAIQGG
jgi:outer membrane protein TolC